MPKSEGELTWKDLEIGAIATEPGSASQYRTGDWRSQKPIYDFKRCIKCGMCYEMCPVNFKAVEKVTGITGEEAAQ